MYFSISRQYAMLIYGEFTPGKISNLSSGLFYHQITGRAIPCFQFMLIKAIEATSGYPTKIDSGRTQSTNRNSLADKSFENLEWPVSHINICIGKPGNEASLDRCVSPLT